MSTERYGGQIIYSCDSSNCTVTFETGTGDFREALDAAKAEGWKPRKVADEWMHFCPDDDCQP